MSRFTVSKSPLAMASKSGWGINSGIGTLEELESSESLSDIISLRIYQTPSRASS